MERTGKRRNSNFDLSFSCPGFRQVDGETVGRRTKRPVNQLFVEDTTSKKYRCADVQEMFLGPTRIEITATFVIEGRSEDPLIEDPLIEDPLIEDTLIQVEKDYELDKEKCPICRSHMDYDFAECFIGECGICHDQNVPCVLSCANPMRNIKHALCEKVCHKRYEN